MIKKTFLLLLVLLCTITAIALAAPGALKLSSAEDVVIAFYKTGNAVPNFENWIKTREPYRTTPLARRPEVMEQETQRLKSLYAAFNPQKDLLTIKTRVRAYMTRYQDKADPETIHHVLKMEFSAGDALFFPYDFMGERFAVIPQEVQQHMNPEVIPEQYDYLNEVLGNGKPMTLIFELRPVKADMEAPFDMDGTGGGVDKDNGKGQWMFLTDIASMSLWTGKGSLLWEYTAPWYVTPMRQNLLDLYVDKEDDGL